MPEQTQADKIPRAPKWRTTLVRTGRAIVLVYLVIVLLFATLQTWLIFPGHAAQGSADTRVNRPLPGTELVKLTTDKGETIVAAFGPALGENGKPNPDRAHCPTVLYFYGNASALNYSWTEFQLFRRLGCNVLIPDFLGYGMSSGSPGEEGVYRTADTAYEYLLKRPDVDKSRIIAAGWSLGAAAAIHVAHDRPVAGLITLSAFTSMADMGRTHYPFLPVSMMLRHRFENQAKLCDVKCPMLLIHGRHDSIVPATCCAALEKSARSKATVLLLDDADHNNVFDADPDRLAAALREFITPIAQARVPGVE